VEDGITGDKSEITRAVDDAMLSLEDNRSRLSTDTIEPAHNDDAPVVDQPSTPPIVPTVSPLVNDAPPIAIDPVPAVTIDPQSKAVPASSYQSCTSIQTQACYSPYQRPCSTKCPTIIS